MHKVWLGNISHPFIDVISYFFIKKNWTMQGTMCWWTCIMYRGPQVEKSGQCVHFLWKNSEHTSLSSACMNQNIVQNYFWPIKVRIHHSKTSVNCGTCIFNLFFVKSFKLVPYHNFQHQNPFTNWKLLIQSMKNGFKSYL